MKHEQIKKTMFLTDAELRDLTGYARNADRRRWLSNHGWRFEVSVTGRPAVSRAHAESMLSGAERRTDPKMNLAAIKNAA